MGYPVDENIIPDGPHGNGYYRARDRKTGKTGYVNCSSNYFIPDPEEEPRNSEAEEGKFKITFTEPGPGEDEYQNALDALSNVVGQELRGSFSQLGRMMMTVLVLFVGVAAVQSYFRSKSLHPDDPHAALAAAGKTVACWVGIIVLFVVALVVILLNSGVEPQKQFLGNIILLVILISLWGLRRVSNGKSFFVDIRKGIRAIHEFYVPKWAYIILVLVTAVMLFSPIANFLGVLSNDWTQEHLDMLTDEMVLILGSGMAIASALIGAVAGLVLCLLVRLVTAKKPKKKA